MTITKGDIMFAAGADQFLFEVYLIKFRSKQTINYARSVKDYGDL